MRTTTRITLVLALCAAPLAGCAAVPSAPAPRTSSVPPSAGGAAPDCPAASVTVSDADELQEALDRAEPGTVIRMADGRYEGRFEIDSSGSADEPIWLCGSADAVLDGGSPETGTVLQLTDAAHWRLVGFGVENGKKGVMADGTSETVFGDLTVRRIGDEAIHLRSASVDNLVVGSTISDTGLRRAEFGEGIYVGTAESNWCDVSDCEPDRSDRNRLVGNDIRATTAEAVDIKEGTTGGLIEGNTFDGSALTGDADSWVDVKGNDWRVVGNTGEHSPRDGFQTHEIVDGWGAGNRFTENVARVDGAGYGFALTPALDNVVDCSNTATGAVKGLSNIECREE